MAAKNIKTIKILGIDTSCDDTAIALLEIQDTKYKILSNIVSSQVKLHAKYGGVYPFLAKREHQKNLPIVFKKATQGKGFDFVAVTVGPGLEPCLWQGINFAKELAQKLNKPLIPVNHIEAHILASFLSPKFNGFTKPIKLPAACLAVSGGHTQLILMEKIGDYKLIGETRDDAAGECFDKVARILGIGYPGGPAIAACASSKLGGRRVSAQLPRPMMYTKDYDFSFSGLKTAVLYKVKKGNYDKIEMCKEVQQAVIDVLIHKTIKAAKDFKAKSIVLGGGVSANEELRRQFSYRLSVMGYGLNFFVPEKILCTDNAAMVAATAFFHRSKTAKDIEAQANLRI